MKNVEVLLFQECGTTPAVGCYEMLRRADRLCREMGRYRRGHGLSVRLVAVGRSRKVRSFDGVLLECDASLADSRRTDLVVVPAFDGELLLQLERNRAVVPWLERRFASGATIASVCTGAFALAEAGLLDGRSATTHWAAQELFRRRYPSVALRPQEIIVDEGRILTSGGAYAFVNMMIYLVGKLLGDEVATRLSRVCLVDVDKSPQGSYAVFQPETGHGDPAILAAQASIDKGVGEDMTVQKLSDRANLSRRQFLRRFRLATGLTPIHYLQQARVEAAKKALVATRDSVDEIAWAVGYTDTVGFRRVFVRVVGLTPREYRRRFRSLQRVYPPGEALAS